MYNIRYIMRIIYYYNYIALGTEKARFGGFLDGKKKKNISVTMSL